MTSDRTYIRQEVGNTHLLIFVHGFTGHYTDTWAQFPDLILADHDLANYDILMWGYPSKKLSRNPEIDRIGGHLKTELDHLPERYKHIVIAAHSMGGLVVRASIISALQDGERTNLTKLKQIVLYGTPNDGIDNADYVPKFINRQIADMRTASDFIIDLRDQWLKRVYRANSFRDQYHLEIPTTAVAGLEDRFVPHKRVKTFFENAETTDGDHSSMVKPENTDHLSFKLLHKVLLKPASDYGMDDAEEIQDIIEVLKQQLDEKERQLSTKDDQLNAQNQQIIGLTDAVTALSQTKQQPDAPEGIDDALKALGEGQTGQAEAIFQSIANTVEEGAPKAAEAYRHLGALAYLHDAKKALNAYRRSAELDPTNSDGWNNLGHLLDRTGDLDGAIAAYEQVLNLGDGADQTTAVAFGNLGLLYRTRGELEKAERFYLKALKINKALLRHEDVATNYGNLGNVYHTRGELDKAEECHLKALKIDEALVHQEGIARHYGNLGWLYQTRGGLNKAEECHLKALKINDVLSNKEGVADNYNNLGELYRTRGKLDKAEEYYLNALKINKALVKQIGMAVTYGNLGIVYRTRGELNKAEEFHLKALKIDKALIRQEGMARQYGNLGIVYQMQDELDKAEEFYFKALKINEALVRQEGMAIQYGNLGNVHRTRGELNKAEEFYLKALKINEVLVRQEGMALDYTNLGLVYHTRGDPDYAREAWKQAMSLFKNIGMESQVQLVSRWIDSLPDSVKSIQ